MLTGTKGKNPVLTFTFAQKTIQNNHASLTFSLNANPDIQPPTHRFDAETIQKAKEIQQKHGGKELTQINEKETAYIYFPSNKIAP